MDAIAHFEAKLMFETDPSDVAAALAAGQDFVLIDSRSDAAWTTDTSAAPFTCRRHRSLRGQRGSFQAGRQ
jgi:hypothetical protein